MKTPLRQNLLATLYDRALNQLEPGAYFGTEKALTEEFGVSLTVVREATLLLVQGGILRRKTGTGLTVAPLPETGTVGIFCEMDLLGGEGAVGWGYRRRFAASRAALAEHGVRYRIYLGSRVPEDLDARVEPPVELLEDLRAGQLAGLVLVGTKMVADLQAVLSEMRVPVVGGETDQLESVEFQQSSERLRTLLKAVRREGCQAPAVMAWFDEPTRESRTKRWAEVLREEGFDRLENVVFGDLTPIAKGAGWEDFWVLWKRSGRQLDALVVMDDFLLPDLERALADFKVAVPEQVRLFALQNEGRGPSCNLPGHYFYVDPEAEGRARARQMLDRLASGRLKAAPKLSLREAAVAARSMSVARH